MTTSRSQRRAHPKDIQPAKPTLMPFQDWLPANQGFYTAFRRWLTESGYRLSALVTYSIGARLALGLLNKPYWQIDPEADFPAVRAYIATQYSRPGTRAAYLRGLPKLDQYIRLRCQRPSRAHPINWSHYLDPLPGWMATDLRAYLKHLARNWPADRQVDLTTEWLSRLSQPLRQMVAAGPIADLTDLTPVRWLSYVDARLAVGIRPGTLNAELAYLRGWLRFLQEQGRAICPQMLKIDKLDDARHLPRDVPIEQLRRLQQAMQAETTSPRPNIVRSGRMDLAWFLLMLHSGLRMGEVRRLKMREIDWENHRVRIEQSKGLKDRLVPLSTPTIQALKAYLALRGPENLLPDRVFIYRQAPLAESYCGHRLRGYYAKRCGVCISPHQLRHSCATLLLNAGAPILTVQTVLGHTHIDTTLGYARLYDGTLAADYYSAMAQVEGRLALPEDVLAAPPSHAELLALIDSLRTGTLNEGQTNAVRRIRIGVMALAEQDAKGQPASSP
jgi:integrase